MMFWKKQGCPKWIEKRLLSLYKQSIRDVLYWRKVVTMERAANNHSEKLRDIQSKYAFAVGEVYALESAMDRLFISYDDDGKVSELYL